MKYGCIRNIGFWMVDMSASPCRGWWIKEWKQSTFLCRGKSWKLSILGKKGRLIIFFSLLFYLAEDLRLLTYTNFPYSYIPELIRMENRRILLGFRWYRLGANILIWAEHVTARGARYSWDASTVLLIHIFEVPYIESHKERWNMKWICGSSSEWLIWYSEAENVLYQSANFFSFMKGGKLFRFYLC